MFSDMLLDSVDPCFDYIPIHTIIPVAWKAPWNGPKECGEKDKTPVQTLPPSYRYYLVNELSRIAALITTGARISAALLSPLCFGALS